MRRMALAVLLAALTIPAAGYAQELVSIADIRQQAKEMGRWTQTYHAYGRTIEVDIPIIVPQVERCPVATVEAMQPFTPEILQRIQENSVMNPQDTREYLYTITEEDGLPERMGDELEFLFKNNATDDTFSTEASQARWLSLSYNSKAYAFFASGSGYAYDLRFAWEMDENTAYAEDNPLTYGEALRITEEIFSGLYPQGENVGIQAYQVFANHRMRKANGQSGVKGDPLEGSPIGSYTIDCYQTLYGLPIGSTITGGAAMDGHTVWPGFNMTGLRSERAFSVYGDGLVKAREFLPADYCVVQNSMKRNSPVCFRSKRGCLCAKRNPPAPLVEIKLIAIHKKPPMLH